jgi:hypothetical protein
MALRKEEPSPTRQLCVRIRSALFAELTERADAEHVSLGAVVNTALAHYLQERARVVSRKIISKAR